MFLHVSVLFGNVSSVVAHLGLRQSGQDGSADDLGVGVQLHVIQQQTGGQQHGCGVGFVTVRDALTCIPGSLCERRHF